MRCHDCGQQFNRWEAFKNHLRMHVLEEEEEGRRQSTKRPGANKEINIEKQKPSIEVEVEEGLESSDVDVDGVENEEEYLDSSWQVKPSAIAKACPPVVILSESEKPAFSNSRRVYVCAICGKVYSYLESFRNHQTMHEQEVLRNQEHKCPDCEKSFVRPSLLLAHLKVHRPAQPMDPGALKCDQCKKKFHSLRSWMDHIELHKRKPHWCSACAKGFRDENSLNKHVDGHNLKRHKCDICFKCFRVPAELRFHYNTHTGLKPYKCTLCKKKFSQLGNLITHRKKHVGVYIGASKTPLGSNTSNEGRKVTKLKRLVFSDLSKSPKLEEDEEELSENDATASESSAEEFESNSPKWSESGSDCSDPEEEEATAVVTTKSNVDGERIGHKEWECFECSMAFDQEDELHQHYMNHARGELPVYQQSCV